MIICVYKGFVMWFLKWDYKNNSLNETILAIITAEHQRIDAFKLEKTLENPLDSKEIKPCNSKRNQPWIVTGRIDTEAETPVLWPPDVTSQFIGKDPDAGKDWGQEKRVTEDEMAGWPQWLNGHEFEQTLGDGKRQRAWQAVQSMGLQRVRYDWVTEQPAIIIF